MSKHSHTIPYVVTLLIIGGVIVGTTTNGPSIVTLTTLSSAVVFIGTSILWLFFSRPIPWLHYGSLSLLGGSIMAYVVIATTANVVYLTWEPCRDVLSTLEKAITVIAQITTLYAGVGLLTALIRYFLRLPIKQLLLVLLPLFCLALLGSIALNYWAEAQELQCKTNWGLRAPEPQ